MGEAKLADKNKGMILELCDELIATCEQAVEENEEAKRHRSTAEALTPAQKSKAVLVTFRSVGNINAETVVSRHRDLTILFGHLSPLENVYSWRIPSII